MMLGHKSFENKMVIGIILSMESGHWIWFLFILCFPRHTAWGSNCMANFTSDSDSVLLYSLIYWMLPSAERHEEKKNARGENEIKTLNLSLRNKQERASSAKYITKYKVVERSVK